MKIRLDGLIHKARLTIDNDRKVWELRVLKGIKNVSFFSRQEIELSGLQIVQTTSGEWDQLATAGFQPPFIRD